jgi:hypothetical protein
MSWLAQYFLNPAFVLPGAALASVPIIIHLLSRLRYRRVRFAAMEFLLQSDEMNRRRLIIEQLLLLFLRVLAILLIVALLARLILDPSGMLLLRGATAHHVLILDDTLSMRDQDGQSTVYDNAVKVLEQMMSAGTYRPRAIRVTVLRITAPDRPLVTDRALDGALLQELIPRIRNTPCSWQSASPVSSLAAAFNILSADAGVAPIVHVITDLRKSDWNERPEVVAALEELGSIDARVNLVQVTDDVRSNLAVVQLTSSSLATAVGVPWRLTATVRNLNQQRASGLRARVFLDGNELPGRVQLPAIEPNSDQLISHDLTFDTVGLHQVEFRLDDDTLNADNRRLMVVNVAPKRRVLLVDDQGRQEDAGFVSAALSSNPELTGIVAERRTSDVLVTTPLQQYDCIYLMNVRELPADAVQLLTKYVKEGGGIAWFPDDQANTDWYSTALQAKGSELFPVDLGVVTEIEISDDSVTPPPFESPVFEDHPIFEVFNVPDSPFPALTLFSKWYRTAPDWKARQGVRVLARLTSNDPVIFEHSLERGRVLTFLTTAGRRWSNWPVPPASPGYVVLHLRMHTYLQHPDDSVLAQELGTPLSLEWSVREFTDMVELFLPDSEDDAEQTEPADADGFVRLQATPLPRNENDKQDADDRLAVNIQQANRPGLYRIRRFTQDGDGKETWAAINVPTSESQLDLADVAQIEQQPELEHVQVLTSDAADGLSSTDTGRELRWFLLGTLLAVLIAEQLLSLRLSFHPEVKA